MIIGISGKMGSGKDTLAEMISTLSSGENQYIVKHHADKLKKIVSLLINVPVAFLNDQAFKRKNLSSDWGMTVRELLQKVGTDGLRNNVHENIWINSLYADYLPKGFSSMEEYLKSLKPGDFVKMDLPNWVIADVRFPNEAEAVREKGGILVRINRDLDVTSDHASETSLDDWHDWDYVVDNNGSKAELWEEAASIIKNAKYNEQ